jgi:hypothetical protein
VSVAAPTLCCCAAPAAPGIVLQMRDALLTTSARRPLNSRLKFDPAQWACV